MGAANHGGRWESLRRHARHDSGGVQNCDAGNHILGARKFAEPSVAPLIVGSDGNFYGVTLKGGTFNEGTVFQLTKKGALKIIYSFGGTGSDGLNPTGGLLQAADGKLYGTAYWGGASGQGTIFSLTTAGVSYKIIRSFAGTDGAHPSAGVIQARDNFLYGVTSAGGGNGDGAFFKINATGTTYNVLHNFDGKASGGSPFATPTLHTNGTFYGWETVGPAEVVLYSMNVGLKPFASLVVVTSGKVGQKVGIIGQGFTTVGQAPRTYFRLRPRSFGRAQQETLPAH